MAPRANSLDSLSSPSPSPTPEVESKKPSEHNASTSTMAHLGSDSELSELTEEEQEAAQTNSKSTSSRRLKGVANGRGGKPSRRGRRKGSSLVPAPMWGWAETKAQDEKDDEQDSADRQTKLLKSSPDDDEEMRDLPDENEKCTDGKESTPAPPTLISEPPQISALDVLSTAAVAAETINNDTGDQLKDSGEIDAENVQEAHVLPLPIPHSISQSDSEMADPPDADSESDAGLDADLDFEMIAPLVETVAPIGAATSITANSAAVQAPPRSSLLLVASSRSTSPDSRSPSLALAAATAQERAPPAVADNDDELEDELDEETERVEDEDDGTSKPNGRKSKGSRAKGKPKRKSKGRAKHKPAPVFHNSAMDANIVTAEDDADGDRSVEDVDVDVEADEDVALANAAPANEEAEVEADGKPIEEEEEEMEIDVEEEEPEPEEQEEPEEEPEPEPEPEEDDDDEEELDLQPAHRVEALDMLATIELSFALVREKLYVEKMTSLAWEESLVEDGTHPELIYLQNELSRRKDKRLQLAARKRSFEFSNISRKRKLDEDAIWSWWKLSRDELQTDMIAETNRKKRKLERDRRQIERPIPVRALPPMPIEIAATMPTLRQLIDDTPFGNKCGHGRSSGKHRNCDMINGKYEPALLATPLAYPELSTLSSNDVKADLDLLFSVSARRSGGYDSHGHGGPLLQPHPLHHPRDGLGHGQRMAGSSNRHHQQHPNYAMMQVPVQPPPGPALSGYEHAHLNQQFPSPHAGGMMNDTFPPSFGGLGKILPHLHHQTGPGPVTGLPLFNTGPRPTSSSGPPGVNGAPGGGRTHQAQSVAASSGPAAHAFPGLVDDVAAAPAPRDRERDRERPMGYGRRSMSPGGGPQAKETGQWMGAGMGMGGFGIGSMHGPNSMGTSKTPRWPGEDDDRDRPRRERERRERDPQALQRDQEREKRHTSTNGSSRMLEGSVGPLVGSSGPGPSSGQPGSQHSPRSHQFQGPHHHHHGKPHHHHVVHHHHHMHSGPSPSPTNAYSHHPAGQSTSPNLPRDSTAKVPPLIGSRPPSVIADERERERERERDRPIPVPFTFGASQYARIPPGPPSSHANGFLASPRPSWGTPPPPKTRSQEEFPTTKSAGATPAPGPPIYSPPEPLNASHPSSPPRATPRPSSPRTLNAPSDGSVTHSPIGNPRSPPPGINEKLGSIHKVPLEALTIANPAEASRTESNNNNLTMGPSSKLLPIDNSLAKLSVPPVLDGQA
ncbi:hypothetical protein E1B28_006296 [Marasmius oreades]|uniref:Uncharacterized protein n=1 Tax=Marasmius oreades TaxID=181124 RepID=A0A9P7S4Z7_9AGAR|nr:uncharacterized protein E1B28_006296 [Marasmius oreades]KAG7095559.1 hypothetical protein E1B28_006296 [Marasmius oreades]